MTSHLVYSTGQGRMCPRCQRPVDRCSCGRGTAAPKGDGVVRVARETKGRKGKCVTLISGLPLDEAGLVELARKFKQRCGTGGTIKDGIIEIQGDHRDVLLAELTAAGHKAKLAGG